MPYKKLIEDISLLVGGGGFLIPYLAGASTLLYERVKFNVLAGLSSGAIVVFMLGLRRTRQLKELVVDSEWRDSLGRNLSIWNGLRAWGFGVNALAGKSITNLEPLREALLAQINDSDGFQLPTYVGVTDMDTGEEEIIALHDLTPEDAVTAVIQSATIPAVLGPAINGKVDMGLRSNLPIGEFFKVREKMGRRTEDLFYVLSKPQKLKGTGTKFRDGDYVMLDAALRGLEIVLQDVLENDLRLIQKHNDIIDKVGAVNSTELKGKRYYRINEYPVAPSKFLGSMLNINFTKDERRNLLLLGERDAYSRLRQGKKW